MSGVVFSEECVRLPGIAGMAGEYEYTFNVSLDSAGRVVKTGPSSAWMGHQTSFTASALMKRDREMMLEEALWTLLLVIPALVVIGLCWNGRPRKWSR